jgi:hypothetical protein
MSGLGGSLDATADGVQGFAAGEDSAGVLDRNHDLSVVSLIGAALSGTGVFGVYATGNGSRRRGSKWRWRRTSYVSA